MAVKTSYFSPLVIKTSALTLGTLSIVIIGLFYLSSRVQAVNRLRYSLQIAQQNVEDLDVLLSDYQTYEKTIATLKTSLPDSYDTYAYAVRLIEQQAVVNSLTLEIKPDQEAQLHSEGVQSVTFTLSAQGSYLNLNSFIKDLSQLPIHTRIDSIDIDGGSPLSATLKVKIYGQAS